MSLWEKGNADAQKNQECTHPGKSPCEDVARRYLPPSGGEMSKLVLTLLAHRTARKKFLAQEKSSEPGLLDKTPLMCGYMYLRIFSALSSIII